jgi:hypothetical protein
MLAMQQPARQGIAATHRPFAASQICSGGRITLASILDRINLLCSDGE